MEPSQTHTSAFHPTRWTLVLRAGGNGVRLRIDAQPLRRREVALPRIEAPKFRRSSFQRSRDNEEIVAAMPAGERVFFGEGCSAIQHGFLGDMCVEEDVRLLVRCVVRQPRQPLFAGNATLEDEVAQRVLELELADDVNAEWLPRIREPLLCRRRVSVRAVERNQKTRVRTDRRRTNGSIRAAHVIEKCVEIRLTQHRLAGPIPMDGAFAEVHRCRGTDRLCGRRAFHHHILAVLDPFNDGRETVSQVVERSGLHPRMSLR